MESLYSTPFSKATLTGLFAGIFTTLICLGYNLFFRETTGFALSDLINVSSLIFVVNLIFLILGIVYYFFITALPKGDIFFILVFILLTVFTAVKSMHVHRSDDQLLNAEFQHLLMMLVIIMGVCGSFGIPFLFHNKQFEEHVV